MHLGVHVSNFTWDGGTRELGPTLAAYAQGIEDAGVQRLSVMDHLWQIPVVGEETRAMLEAYTALGYIAAKTEKLMLHTLVTGVTYRAPGLLAKAVSTLDVLSGGRAGLGIGAAWFEEETRGLGLDFPSTKERFERLEEAIQISLQMWSDSEGPFHGKHYHLERTLNSPAPVSSPRPYLMIGGSGERKTLRLVAQYADACNIFFGPETAHKLDVLAEHCDALGRDYQEIERTSITRIDESTSREQLIDTLGQYRDATFTVTYVMCRHANPLAALDVLADAAAEVSPW